MSGCASGRVAVAGGAIAWLLVSLSGVATQGGEERRRPDPPPPRPPIRMPMPMPPSGRSGELPDTPETPPEKLPAQYFAAVGEVEIRYSQWTKAQEAFRQAYDREKDAERRVPYAYRLGQLHMRNKEFDKALPLIEEAAKNEKSDPRSYRTQPYRTSLAKLYEKMGQPDKVEALYQEWIESAESRYDKDLARRQLLHFWQRTGRLDAVIQRYHDALAKAPDEKEALAMLRLIYTSVKPDDDKAVAIAEKLTALDPDDRDTALQLLGAYERAGKYDKAIPLLEQFIDKNPADAAFLSSRLVHCYVRADQKDKAVAFARKLLERDPQDPRTHSRVAGIYQQLGMVDDSLAEYEAAAGLARSDTERDSYLLSAAHAARRARKYAKAEELAKKLAQSQSKATAAQAKRLLFELYEVQNKLDQLELGVPGDKKE